MAEKTKWWKNIDIMGPITSGIGVIQSGLGAMFDAKSKKSSLQFQSYMAEQNAQSIMAAGEREQGRIGLHGRKVKGSQRASQAARGIALNEGSAAEEEATTELMMQEDLWTINANTLRETANARSAGLMAGASADSISPFGSMLTGLMEGATAVAPSWYGLTKKPV